MTTENQTPEQTADAQAALQAATAQAAEAKKAAKAEKDAAKQAAKEAKAQAKAEKDALAAAAKAEKDAAKAAKQAAKDAAKAAKETQKQPVQNGVRRPGPEGKCGRVWALADQLSAALRQPVPVADLLKAGEAEGLNPSNIRTEYAQWKKFNGLTGRITKPVETAETAAA